MCSDCSTSTGLVVIKGYHMGSKWFAETMNRVPGAAFFFEYEHCLKRLSLNHGVSIPVLAENATLRFLRTSCKCERSFDCRGCGSELQTNEMARQTDCGSSGISIASR